jgi:Calponin homology (CH) domain
MDLVLLKSRMKRFRGRRDGNDLLEVKVRRFLLVASCGLINNDSGCKLMNIYVTSVKLNSCFLKFTGVNIRWMESCLGEDIPPIVMLEECLRNGVILARLARVFAPDLVPRIFEAPELQFKHSDNINRFFRFVERVGLPDVFNPFTPSLIPSNSVSNSPTCTTKRTFPK